MDNASYAAIMRNVRHAADFIRLIDYDELLDCARARAAPDSEIALIVMLADLAAELPKGHH